MTNAAGAVRTHWPEYLAEAACLGLFMISACGFGTLLWNPFSPVPGWVPDAFPRRVLMGCAMGLTAIGIIYSPLGQRSGAHMNPAVTLTFWTLGKIAGWDAVFYAAAQFAGGIAGVALSAMVLGGLLSHPNVFYVVTKPGPWGEWAAFAAEAVISAVLMFTVLAVSNSARWARYTPLFAGTLVATYITFEDPLSGMSMNPARTFGSAMVAQAFAALWVYFLAPPIGMLAASRFYRRTVHCAKLYHFTNHRCIFRCAFGKLGGPTCTTT